MYQNCCRKCGSTSLHAEVKGNNTGLYCDDCGAWIKWLGKDELRAFEHSQKSQLPKTSCDIPMPEVVEIDKPKKLQELNSVVEQWLLMLQSICHGRSQQKNKLRICMICCVLILRFYKMENRYYVQMWHGIRTSR